MRVNTGGDPGRDDYGLPPVDIEIPDDARELDGDVQAYYRELRSRRRRTLAKRVYGPLASDGMVLPLLAGCLALTLLAATLLTVFTVGQGTVGGPAFHPNAGTALHPNAGTALHPSARAARSPAPAGHPGGRLPDAMVLVDGQQEHLNDITGGYFVVVLALVPPACMFKCQKDLRQLIQEAQAGKAQPYLFSTSGQDMSKLSYQTGLGGAHAVDAFQSPLPQFYSSKKILTAVLINKDGTVAKLVTDKHGFQIKAALAALASEHAEQTPPPGGNQPEISQASPPG
jgi:hypothetical protein